MPENPFQLNLFRTPPTQSAPPSLPKAGNASSLGSHPTNEMLEAFSRARLIKVGAPELAARIHVRWNPRMRSTAGMASPARALVTLNPRLCEFGAAELERTLLHELAHLLAHARAGRRRIAPHGPEWKRACTDLGLVDEKRCHNLPLPQRTLARPHLYECPRCKVQVDRVRPFRGKAACLDCCRTHNRGQYDDRFRFRPLPQPKRA